MYEQKIYFGAPGSGKSHLVKEMLSNNNIPETDIFRVTIHPEFTYSDFVGQLLPEFNSVTNRIEFPFKKGPFTRALAKAYSDYSRDVFLVIEELSRGNVAAIFGDLFQLLDRDEYFNSKYPVNNKSVADQIVELPTDDISLISNFNIIGTVNMNDQNVFPMDTAFKRRFDWEYISTRPATDDSGNRLRQLNNPKMLIHDSSPNIISTNWQSFYTALNKFITDKENGLGKNEDKQLGQFFIDFNNSLIINSYSSNPSTAKKAEEEIESIIRSKLLLYLWQDVEGSYSFGTRAKLFAEGITSFDDLYFGYGNDKVFSKNFLDNFLIPDKDLYPY